MSCSFRVPKRRLSNAAKTSRPGLRNIALWTAIFSMSESRWGMPRKERTRNPSSKAQINFIASQKNDAAEPARATILLISSERLVPERVDES